MSDHADDLRLAAACVAGDPAALAELEEKFRPGLVLALRTIDSSASYVDEMLQRVRHHLLVGDGGAPPRLASYSGSGPLSAWLRVAALRLALGERRKQRREVPLEDALTDAAGHARSPQQELAYREHAAALQQALRTAIAARPARMRSLLRYYYIERVGVEELGRMYRVHASTISRWLAQTRDEILADTRRLVAAALARSEDDVDSLLGIAGSLEVSLQSLLRSPAQ